VRNPYRPERGAIGDDDADTNAEMVHGGIVASGAGLPLVAERDEYAGKAVGDTARVSAVSADRRRTPSHPVARLASSSGIRLLRIALSPRVLVWGTRGPEFESRRPDERNPR
jgi:hypothetical protein